MTDAEIEAHLRQGLAADSVALENESALHVGHVGAQGGGGHFRVTIVSSKFQGLSRVARHRLVYDSLADLMQHRIHALSIVALTPKEATRADPAAKG